MTNTQAITFSLLIMVFIVGIHADLYLNIDQCQAQKYDNWDALYCPCSGGSGDYQYQFTKLPTGWFTNRDRIYIPKIRIQPNKYYSLKVNVFDKNNRQAVKRSILFNYGFDNRISKFYDADFDVDFDDKFVLDQFINNRVNDRFRNQNVDNIANRVVPQKFFGNSFIPNQVVPNQVVLPQVVPTRFVPTQAVVQGFEPRRSSFEDRRNPYYNNLPSDQQVQRAINNPDGSKLKQLIQLVIQCGLQCKVRAKFLQQLQNKIQTRVAAFRTDAQNNKQSIFSLEQQIKTLKAQIQNLSTNTPDNDKIKGFKDQLNKIIQDKDGFERQARNSRENIQKLRIQIENSRNENIYNFKNLFDQEERNCKDIDAKIAEYQAKIRDLKAQKEQCRRKRDEYQNRIGDPDRKINQCNTQINSHQLYMKDYQEKIKRCQDSIRDLNKKIEQEALKQNYQQKRQKVAALQQQASENRKQANDLVKLYTELERYQNQFENSINKHYYGCYQYFPVKDNKDDNKITAPSSAFLAYLKQIFGQVPNQNIRSRFSGSINLKKHTIFSPSWTKVYGIPFTAGYGSNRDISEDNFKCTEDSINVKVFSGRIQQITKNVIQVISKSGDRYTVHLGGCTKIQSALDKQIPEKGAQIFFKGIQRPNFKNHFNGHHVTCY